MPSSNILSPHEIQQLIDRMEQQAIRLETEAIAKKHVKNAASQAQYLAASRAAAVTRHQIQELAALLHQ
jgi:hypothetical protein